MTLLSFALILKYCLVSSLFAVAMFSSAQVARFLSFAALGTAFLAAGIGRHHLTGFVLVDCGILIAVAATVGICTSVIAALLHGVAGVDRVTAGVITYFLAYGSGLIVADGGMARLPAKISPPSVLAANAIMSAALLSCVGLLVFYSTRTASGLRAIAFSKSPEFAGRFGSFGKVSDVVPIYLPALFFGEFIAGLGGCMSLYLEGSTSLNYALQPILIGVIAAGVAQFAAWRARIWVRLLITLAISTLWALIFAIGADLQLPQWAADMKEGFVALALAVVILFVQGVVKTFQQARRPA